MPVIFTPHFLEEVLNKGVQGFQMGQGIKHHKEAKAMGEANLMSQLFAQGAIESPGLQTALGNAGIKTPVAPSKTERRRKALEGGDTVINALSDDEKTELGFKTAAEKTIEGAKVSGATLETRRNQALEKFMAGDDIDDQSREVLGLMSKGDRELKKLTTMDPYLGQLGERHVAGELVKNQGRIGKGGVNALAENAYANYVTERSAHGLGGLTPEQIQYTRSYFQRAAQNALIAQHKMDLEGKDAETRRIGANSMADQRGMNTNLQWFGKITTAMDTVRKQQQDLLRANPALAVALDNPALASSPMIAGAMERYNQLEQTAEAFRGAQGSLAEGNVPGNLAALLEAAGGMTAPPPSAGKPGSPAGAAPPKPAGPPPGPTPGVDPAIDQKIEAAAAALASGQGSTATLQAYIVAGAITQDQYAKIVARAEVLKKQQEKERMKGGSADTFSSGGQRRR